MPNIAVPKEKLEQRAPVPAGTYEVRLDGFKPAWSKDKPGKSKSVNLNPQMKIINNPDSKLMNQNVFDSLNIQAGWVHREFSHAFGHKMESDDGGANFHIPGKFDGPDDDPSKWQYHGPLVGGTAKLEISHVSNQTGGTRSAIRRYVCKVPGCTENHIMDLT